MANVSTLPGPSQKSPRAGGPARRGSGLPAAPRKAHDLLEVHHRQSDDADQADVLVKAGAEVICLPAGPDKIDMTALMHHLAGQGVNELLVEAGATLCGSLLDAQLVDELVVYIAPYIMGHNARGMFHLPALESMTDRVSLTIRDIRAVGDDWRITSTPNFNAV